jgi:hypothetical protein
MDLVEAIYRRWLFDIPMAGSWLYRISSNRKDDPSANTCSVDVGAGDFCRPWTSRCTG